MVMTINVEKVQEEIEKSLNSLFDRSTSKLSDVHILDEELDKVVFLYDNGKSFTASGIDWFNADAVDAKGKLCIDYSGNHGLVRVYPDELAALTLKYTNGSVEIVPLNEKVVVETNVRMQRKSVKTDKPVVDFTAEDNQDEVGA